MTMETRSAELWPIDFEIRSLGDDGFEFEGYVAKYNEPSFPLAFPGINRGRPFREIIRPGAFTKSLSERPDIALVVNHQLVGLPLARTGETMTLESDSIGLRARGTLPDDELGRPVRNALKRRTVRGMSFRFDKALDKWTSSPEGSVRELLEVRLRSEVSFATFPAYDATEATVRALAEEADVDPEALIAALSDLKPGQQIAPESREVLITVINKHSDAPVIDAAAASTAVVSAVTNLTSRREKLNAIAPR